MKLEHKQNCENIERPNVKLVITLTIISGIALGYTIAKILNYLIK